MRERKRYTAKPVEQVPEEHEKREQPDSSLATEEPGVDIGLEVDQTTLGDDQFSLVEANLDEDKAKTKSSTAPQELVGSFPAKQATTEITKPTEARNPTPAQSPKSHET